MKTTTFDAAADILAGMATYTELSVTWDRYTQTWMARDYPRNGRRWTT